MTAGVEGAMQGRCANHVESVAVGTCERCGSYYCASCYKQLAGKRICSACLAIPGIDYLADARNKAWGKRDAWVWYLGGLGTLSYAAMAAVALLRGNGVEAWINAALIPILFSYLLLLRWSRIAVFAAVPLSGISAALRLTVPHDASERPGYEAGYMTGAVAVRALFVLAVLVTAYRSPRNKLAFKLDVSGAEWAAYYEKYLAKPDVKRALAYGLGSLLLPVLIPVALVFGARAVRRLDAQTSGARFVTFAGMFATAGAVLMWSAWLSSWLRR